MVIIGVTGGSGSGKTSFLREAEDRGALVLDCDEIYHALLETSPGLLADIEQRFPGSVEDGVLARKKLGAQVFNDPAALLELNGITHRHVMLEVERRLQEAGELAVIDAIGLFESSLSARCTVTVCITAPEAVRIRRIMAREGITEDYARARIRAQKPEAWYMERADYTLCNDYPTEKDFRKAAGAWLSMIMERYTDHKVTR